MQARRIFWQISYPISTRGGTLSPPSTMCPPRFLTLAACLGSNLQGTTYIIFELTLCTWSYIVLYVCPLSATAKKVSACVLYQVQKFTAGYDYISWSVMCVLRFCIQIGHIDGGRREAEGGGVRPPRFWNIRKRLRQCRHALLLLATPDFQTFHHACGFIFFQSSRAF